MFEVEYMENEVVKGVSLKKIFESLFWKSDDTPKENSEESSEIDREFESVDEKLDEKERNIRIGRLVVSKERSQAIRKVKLKEGPTLKVESHESNNYIEEDKEIAK